MMPQPVAQECVSVIGTIRDMLHMIFGKEILHIRAGDAQHGAKHIAADGRDGAQTLQSCATDQMHQHGFRVVIGGVGRGNFAGQSAQKRVADVTGSGFQSLFAGNHVAGTDQKGNAIAVAKVPDEFFIPVRFFPPEMVVKMGGGQLKSQLILQ